MARLGKRVAHALGAHQPGGRETAHQRAARVGGEVDETRVARRQEHLQRLQRERQRQSRGERQRRACPRRRALRRQRDEDAERHIGDDVGDDVEAGPAQRPRREWPEAACRARARSRAKRAAGWRTRSRARRGARARAAAACGGDPRSRCQQSCARRSPFVRGDRRETRIGEHRQRAVIVIGRLRVRRRPRSTETRPPAQCPRAARLSIPAASSARAMPCRRRAGVMTKHTIAAASCGATGSGGSAMRIRAHAWRSFEYGCAFIQPTTSSPAYARKPSISAVAMRAVIAMRFARPSKSLHTSAGGTS